MKILKKKIFFLRLGIFFSNWEKSHLNPIGKGAEFLPLRTPKKIPAYVGYVGLRPKQFTPCVNKGIIGVDNPYIHVIVPNYKLKSKQYYSINLKQRFVQ